MVPIFFTGDVFECDLAHRRSVAVLCMLCKIMCKTMHPLYGALPVLYVQVRVTPGAVISHRYTYAPPRCRTSQYRRNFISLSVSLWNDLSDPMFVGVGLAGFKSFARTPYNEYGVSLQHGSMQRNEEFPASGVYCLLILLNEVRLRLGCPGSLLSLYGRTLHTTPIDLCTVFIMQTKYILCNILWK